MKNTPNTNQGWTARKALQPFSCAAPLLISAACVALLLTTTGCYERVVSTKGGIGTGPKKVYQSSEDDLFILKDIENAVEQQSRERE